MGKGSVLEIGTATGRFVEFVVGIGSIYTGLDLSRAMLKHVSEKQSQLMLADGKNIREPSSSSPISITLPSRKFQNVSAC